MVPSVNELRARFAEAKYIVEQDTIRQVYLAGVRQEPILIGGPPGCNKTELAKAVPFALDTKMERLECYRGCRADLFPDSKKTAKESARSLVCDSKQFNLEDERCAARYDRRASPLAISNAGRTHQLGFSSDLHSLNAFGPARNHLIQRKLSGLVSFIRAVELGSIGQGPAVIHGYNVAGSRRRTRAGSDFAIDQTARRLDRTGFCRGLIKKRGGFGF